MTFSVRGIEADAVKALLAEAAINVSTSSPSSTLLDATARGIARQSCGRHLTTTIAKMRLAV